MLLDKWIKESNLYKWDANPPLSFLRRNGTSIYFKVILFNESSIVLLVFLKNG